MQKQRLSVDGEDFDVRTSDRPGHYLYDWVSGPNPGYGFGSLSSDGSSKTIDEHVRAIRDFLSSIDPTTGYIEDDEDDEGDDEDEDEDG